MVWSGQKKHENLLDDHFDPGVRLSQLWGRDLLFGFQEQSHFDDLQRGFSGEIHYSGFSTLCPRAKQYAKHAHDMMYTSKAAGVLQKLVTEIDPGRLAPSADRWFMAKALLSPETFCFSHFFHRCLFFLRWCRMSAIFFAFALLSFVWYFAWKTRIYAAASSVYLSGCCAQIPKFNGKFWKLYFSIFRKEQKNLGPTSLGIGLRSSDSRSEL